MLLNKLIPTKGLLKASQAEADLVVGREDLPDPKAMAALFVFTYSSEQFVDELCRINGGYDPVQKNFWAAKAQLTNNKSLFEKDPHGFEAACLALKEDLDLNDEAEAFWKKEEEKYVERVRDLIQERPDFDMTTDGKRPVASVITEDDMWQGGMSPGVFIAMCGQILMGFVAWNLIPTHFLTILVGSLSFIASLFLTGTIERARKGRGADHFHMWVMTYFMPAFGPMVWSTGFQLGSHLFGGHVTIGPHPDPITALLSYVTLVVVSFGLLVGGIGDGEVLRETFTERSAHKLMSLLVVNALLILPGVFMSLNNFAYLLAFPFALCVPSLLGLWREPWLYVKNIERSRAFELVIRDKYSQGLRNGLSKNAHRKFRFEQLLRAAGDDSKPIVLGEATGYFIEKGSRNAPEAGQQVVMTRADFLQHFMSFGRSGSGKTSSLILPVVTQWYQNGLGGYLILCGKGVLALDFKDVPGFTLIKPGVPLGLYENMEPQGVVRAYEAVSKVDEALASGSGNAQFFIQAAKTLFSNITYLLFYAAEAEMAVIEARVQNGEDKETLMSQRQYTVTPWKHSALLDLVSRWKTVNGNLVNMELLALIDYIMKHHPLVVAKKYSARQSDGTTKTEYEFTFASTPEAILMKKVIDELKNIGLSEAPETRQGIFKQVKNWVEPLFTHPDLLAWTQMEHGVRVESVLEGKGMGPYLPADIYGQGALLIQSLIKDRVMTKIHNRTNQWMEDRTQTHVMVVIDEAHVPGMVVQKDIQAASQFRSKGCSLNFAAQNLSSYVSALGEHKAMALIDNFSTVAGLETGTSVETREFLKRVMGEGMVRHAIYPSHQLLMKDTVLSAIQYSAFDKDHPEHQAFLRMRRQGSHGFESVLPHLDMSHASHLDRHSEMSKATYFPLITSSVREFKPWVESGEIDANLKQGVALIKWYRSGFWCHDFVKVKYMKSTTSKPQ